MHHCKCLLRKCEVGPRILQWGISDTFWRALNYLQYPALPLIMSPEFSTPGRQSLSSPPTKSKPITTEQIEQIRWRTNRANTVKENMVWLFETNMVKVEKKVASSCLFCSFLCTLNFWSHVFKELSRQQDKINSNYGKTRTVYFHNVILNQLNLLSKM